MVLQVRHHKLYTDVKVLFIFLQNTARSPLPTTDDNVSANCFTGHQFDFPLICLRRLALPLANVRVYLSNKFVQKL